MRSVIALYSPAKISETGLHSALQRIAGRLTPFDPTQSFLSTPRCGRISQNTGMFCVFRGKRRGVSPQFRLGLESFEAWTRGPNVILIRNQVGDGVVTRFIRHSLKRRALLDRGHNHPGADDRSSRWVRNRPKDVAINCLGGCGSRQGGTKA
jgi:hypothetical protein